MLALSSPQEQIWLHQALHPGVPLYNIGGYLDIAGPLDIPRFQHAVQHVIDRHDGLRLTIDSDSPRLEQTLIGSLSYTPRVIDLRSAPDSAAAWATREFRTPFPMDGGPLFDFALLRLDERRHWWFMKFHHLIVDGWAISLVAQAGAAAYAGRLTDGPATSYESFVEADAAYRASARFTQDQEFWQDKFQSRPARMLPRRRDAPPGPTSRKRTWRMPRAVYDELNALCAAHDVSCFHLFVAVLGCCLLNRGDAAELPIGLPVLNRRDSAAKKTIGLFAVINPTRVTIDPTRSLLAIADSIKTTVARDYRHHSFPLRRLNALLGMPTAGVSTLFDVVLSFERHDYNVEFAGARGTMYAMTNGYEQNALCVFVRDYNDHAPVHVDFEYNLAAFDADGIDALARRVEEAFAWLLRNPDHPAAPLAATARPATSRATVHPGAGGFVAAFTAAASRAPEAIAVESADGSLSFDALNRRANRLARYLQMQGAGPETVIAVRMERTCALPVAVLAIMKAGAAFLPIDPVTPWLRVERMLARAGASLLIADDGRPEGTIPWLSAEDIQSRTAALDDSDVRTNLDRDSLAYVIFTSGSTAEPKGVMVTHGALSNYLEWALSAYPMPPGSAVPVHSSLGFDATLTAFFPPLMTGGRVVLLPGDDAIEALAERLKTQDDLGLVKLTPAHLDVLRELVPSGARVPLMVVGGEALTGAHLQHWRATAPGTRIVNEYGPTETVVGCAAYEVPSGCDAVSVPIGTAIDGARIHIVDSRGGEVVDGEEGEIWIGGAGVARGYAGRPDLTAERFIPDPFSEVPGARIYRSGDRGRRRGGQLEYLGRRDRMVKIHGHRIELEEIEAVLQACPLVRMAAVTVDRTPGGHRRLVAHVAIDDRAAAARTDGEVRDAIAQHVSQRLPPVMRPLEYHFSETLPLTLHAKIDRAALDASRAAAAPSPAVMTPVESALAAIWSDLLRHPVTAEDDFFRLGGDSIVALQVVARARARGIRVTLSDIFAGRTLGRVAGAATPASQPPLLEATPADTALALSPAQRWLFEVERDFPREFTQFFRLDLPADVDIERWCRALAFVVARHQVFSWRFMRAQDRWTARRSSDPPHLALLRLPPPPDAAPDAERDAAAAGTLFDALDIERGPTIGAAICGARDDGRTEVTLAAHHLVVDGVSWRIILEDLHQAYTQMPAGNAAPPMEPATSFARWTAALAEHIGPRLARRSREFWLREARADRPTFPSDFPASGPSLVAHERRAHTVCSANLTATLQQRIAPAHQATVEELILAALSTSVARETGDPRVYLDLEGHGRRVPVEIDAAVDLSRTVGWFTATYPLQLAMPAAADTAAAIAEVTAQLRAIPDGGLGYSVLRYTDVDPSAAAILAAAPRPPVLFNFLGQFDGTLAALGEWRLSAARSTGLPSFGLRRHPLARRTHPIEVTGFIEQGMLHLVWAFDPQVHAPDRLERLAAGTIDALEAFARADDPLRSASPSNRPGFPGLDADSLARLAAMIDLVDAADAQ